jgi:hypothetical protein
MSYNFLVASWGGAGHLGPALTAARQLRANGHGVRFIARVDAREPVEAAGFGFATWQRLIFPPTACPATFGILDPCWIPQIGQSGGIAAGPMGPIALARWFLSAQRIKTKPM